TNAANIYQSGAQQLRRSGAIAPGQVGTFNTVQQYLSWGDFDKIADFLLGLAPTAAQGKQNAPIDPKTGSAITGVGQIGLRNSCDRMGNGSAFVQQTITMTNGVPVVAFNPGYSAANATPLRCFPEDWLRSNPQFGTVQYNTNTGRSSY